MAAVSGNEIKVSMKIVVDTRAKKVLFAEAKKEFVDFLFYILSLPLSTVVKLLNEKGMAGCLGSLYKSVKSLDTEYFVPNINKDSLLNSKLPVVVPLLPLNDTATPTQSDYYYNRGMTVQSYSYPNETPRNAGYVKAAVTYMVMDDLEVKPLSVAHLKNHINDFDYLDETQVQVGVDEALAMLKASLETKAVLTTVFLGKNSAPSRASTMQQSNTTRR